MGKLTQQKDKGVTTVSGEYWPEKQVKDVFENVIMHALATGEPKENYGEAAAPVTTSQEK